MALAVAETGAEVPVVVRDYSAYRSWRLYPLGDVHKGSPAHAAVKWQRWLAYLAKTRNASLLGTGDFFNAALKDSKSESYDEVLTVGQAKRELLRELEPVARKGRLDLLEPGNHENRIYRATGYCPVEDMAEQLGVPYAAGSALVLYRVGDQEYRVYVRHGTGNGQAVASLAKAAQVIDADVYVTGHTHRQAVLLDDYFREEDGVVKRAKRFYVSSGSFVEYERYAAERGYVPAHLGAPRIYLDGGRHDVHVSV